MSKQAIKRAKEQTNLGQNKQCQCNDTSCLADLAQRQWYAAEAPAAGRSGEPNAAAGYACKLQLASSLMPTLRDIFSRAPAATNSKQFFCHCGLSPWCRIHSGDLYPSCRLHGYNSVRSSYDNHIDPMQFALSLIPWKTSPDR